jgi:hypothetical protein
VPEDWKSAAAAVCVGPYRGAQRAGAHITPSNGHLIDVAATASKQLGPCRTGEPPAATSGTATGARRKGPAPEPATMMEGNGKKTTPRVAGLPWVINPEPNP